jgi:hypothetical protein
MRARLLLIGTALLCLLLGPIPDASANIFACCTGDLCTEVTESTCTAGGGIFFPNIVSCTKFTCQVPAVGGGGLLVLAVALLGAATWLLARRRRAAPEP